MNYSRIAASFEFLNHKIDPCHSGAKLSYPRVPSLTARPVPKYISASSLLNNTHSSPNSQTSPWLPPYPTPTSNVPVPPPLVTTGQPTPLPRHPQTPIPTLTTVLQKRTLILRARERIIVFTRWIICFIVKFVRRLDVRGVLLMRW